LTLGFNATTALDAPHPRRPKGIASINVNPSSFGSLLGALILPLNICESLLICVVADLERVATDEGSREDGESDIPADWANEPEEEWHQTPSVLSFFQRS
jgi:hypothetical protein